MQIYFNFSKKHFKSHRGCLNNSIFSNLVYCMCCILSTFYVSSWIVTNINESSLLLSQLLYRSCWSINNLNNLLIVNDKNLRDSSFTFRLEQINSMSDGLYVLSRNRCSKECAQTYSKRFPFQKTRKCQQLQKLSQKGLWLCFMMPVKSFSKACTQRIK